MPESRGGISLQPEDLPDSLERVPEHEPAALGGAEEVGGAREGRALDPLEQNGGPLRRIEPTLDLRHLQAGIHLLGDTDQVAVALEVFDTGSQAFVGHIISRVFRRDILLLLSTVSILSRVETSTCWKKLYE